MPSPTVEPSARARSVRIDDDALVVERTDGRTVSQPIIWFPRPTRASAAERNALLLLGDGEGIHWPDVDEDLSVAALLAGHDVR